MPFEDKNLAIERLETQKMFSSKQISKLNSASFYSSLTSSSKVSSSEVRRICLRQSNIMNTRLRLEVCMHKSKQIYIQFVARRHQFVLDPN